MGRQSAREQFIVNMHKEGMSIEAARTMMRYAATLHRLAELESSSEAAAADRVPCPFMEKTEQDSCLCKDRGAYDHDNLLHGRVPRIVVQAWRTEQRAAKLAEQFKMTAVFGGDPRGAAIVLKVPSGKTDDWGQTGMCVPQGRS